MTSGGQQQQQQQGGMERRRPQFPQFMRPALSTKVRYILQTCRVFNPFKQTFGADLQFKVPPGRYSLGGKNSLPAGFQTCKVQALD